VVSEQVPEDYLATLREKGISYIVSGKSSVDLTDAVNQLGEHFESALYCSKEAATSTAPSWRPIWLMR
jgi:riboflavin biosynthesis pyrimidine reductase